MKNRKMSTTLTCLIGIAVVVCIAMLHGISSNSLNHMTKEAELNQMNSSLHAQTELIEEFIAHQEDLLMGFGKASVVKELLKDPENEQKRQAAQAYTEAFYEDLEQWEGLYIAELSTHIIAHSKYSGKQIAERANFDIVEVIIGTHYTMRLTDFDGKFKVFQVNFAQGAF